MQVLVAEVSGMCFGVRDALRTAEAVPSPEGVTIYGQLVHNEVVLTRLGARGFRMLDEADRDGLPETARVMITAHGVSDADRRRLEEAGKELIDTTCPLVARAHEAARRLQREGWHVLVVGKPGHVEVRGIVGDLTSFDVVESPTSVRRYPHPRLGVVCQTTTPPRLAEEVRVAIVERNPHAAVRFIDTICHPTRAHQRAVEDLCGRVEAMVVVGGKNSNNTRALVELCRERGVPAYHVQHGGELRAEWFRGVRSVGLTAGTSTLDETLAEVRDALERFPEGR